MSKREYKELSDKIKSSLRIAEKDILQAKAARNETLVLWNSETETIEHVPAVSLLQRNKSIAQAMKKSVARKN